MPQIETVKPKLTIVMGVSGSGKSVIGQKLAQELDYLFIDADDFHSDEARALMAQGTPLDDNYRVQWIAKLSNYLNALRCQNQSCVLAYSGLKAVHRDQFRQLGFEQKFYH